MKLFNFTGFELPAIFSKMAIGGNPPDKHISENRPAHDALTRPNFQIYNPETLHFPDHTLPTVPGHGGYITCGLNMVEYDHQAKWDRDAVYQAGPVRQFFRDMMYDNRIKHI